MTENLPAEQEQPLEMRWLKMTHQLAFHAGTYSADRNRLRRLVSFAPRAAKKINGKDRDVSKVQYNDRPEVELYLWHRDRVLELADDVEKFREKLGDVKVGDDSAAESMAAALASLNGLEEKRLKHVAAMEKILETLAKEQAAREGVMAKLAADGAKLALAAHQHKDRMEIAREGSKVESADTLRARLAMKYGCTPEQVDDILKSKGDNAGD